MIPSGAVILDRAVLPAVELDHGDIGPAIVAGDVDGRRGALGVVLDVECAGHGGESRDGRGEDGIAG